MKKYKLGIDIGSTTIKIALIDSEKNLIFSRYQRHFSNIKETIINMITEAIKEVGNITFSAMITGSGGLSLATWVGLDFIQEVVAVSRALDYYEPRTDVAIEIGGEDAKIIYFQNGIEQRMNGICAGGTGSFIDQMATLLQTDSTGLNELAKDYTVIYPIAARCGVFAKSDIQPLINEGAAKSDLAASIFQSIVSQTISGLACGKPIRGNVAFLGGPLYFLTELKKRFIEVLQLEDSEVIAPENSHLFAAIGSALNSKDDKQFDFQTIILNLQNKKVIDYEVTRLPALFENKADYTEFKERHNKAVVKKSDIKTYKGDAFLGIDAGSTTTKLALVGEDSELLYSYYGSNEGDPVKVIIQGLNEIYANIPKDVKIRNSCITGYGEGLGKAALRIDLGEIETVAHYKAASTFLPDVDFILDIGGQDMKCIHIKENVINNVHLNEACSAGCGSFIETFAKSLDYPVSEFANIALMAKKPIDLGSRCTVFMNSRVKQAQKEGADVSDISSGLSYSVIKNAMQKVIKINDPNKMGKNIVVQGGTFYNESVLRAFELISEREAIRPDIAGIMGAFGAAIISKEKYVEGYTSSLLTVDEMNNLKIESSLNRCRACNNKCLLTINKFSGGRRFVSGNRCEIGAGKEKNQSSLPNMFNYKLERLFNYIPLDESKAKRGSVGIPRVLNMYENYPLWFTFFTNLGYRVILSPNSTRSIYEKGLESIPSESACYPAKLVHGHIMCLIEKGINFIFYPSVSYEKKEIENADNNFNCPIVTSYPETIKNNVEEVRERKIDFRKPFLNLNDKKSLLKTLCNEFSDISTIEIIEALDLALEEAKKFRLDIQKKGEESLKFMEDNDVSGIVLSGRPYHVDPEINHGIPELVSSYGFVVLTEDSVSHIKDVERPLIMRDQWAYHSRMYTAAALVSSSKNLELIQLNSFGCGLDAVTTEELNVILENSNKIYTCLKIDEVNNLGSARIRIRSLMAAMEERKGKDIKISKTSLPLKRVTFTKKMRKTHTILCPQMSPIHFGILQEAFKSSGYNLEIMPSIDKTSVDTGLKYVNNDACYPAIIVVGQILNAIKSGKYDLKNTSVVISQTGGGCRASNYIGFIRKALVEANYPDIPVISFSSTGLEKNPGMQYTPQLLNRCMQSLVYGDLLMRCLYKVRPYETRKGSANKLFEKWEIICKNSVRKADYKIFKKNIYSIVSEFDTLEITKIQKPKIGIVGEIFVKYNPTANNDAVALLESEGAEVVVPDLIDFLLYCLFNSDFKADNLGAKQSTKFISKAFIKIIEQYRKHLKEALDKSERFEAPPSIYKLSELASPIVSLGHQTGEGWFLTAEMLELLETGVNNILCMQPFACLPNHVLGKGLIKELRRKYPLSNIVAIDYDSGASEVNQLNRIKLMMDGAIRNIDKVSAKSDKVLNKGKSKVKESFQY